MLYQQVESLSYADYSLKLQRFPLRSGQIVDDVTIAYRVHGFLGNPLVFVLGGISAHRGLCDSVGSKKAWWRDVVGPGKSIDTETYCVVGIDFIGGDGDSTGPLGEQWQSTYKVDTGDQGRALLEITKALGYRKIHTIVGSSYGAMVGLTFSQEFPALVDKVIAISGAHRSHPMAMAWRYLQRELLQLASGAAESGDSRLRERMVTLSRALAITTYRSPEEFAQRFDNIQEVAGYLEHCGQSFATARNHKSYYCLSESIDSHDIEIIPNNVELHIIGFEEDRLVPKDILHELSLKSGGYLHLFHSLYGHDAFLKEFTILNRLLPKLLQGNIR